MNLPNSEKDDPEVEDLFETLLNSGQEVSYQDWDSGGPGAGAGRVSVYRYKDQFYSIHDAGMDGPFATSAEAVESSGIDDINDATIAIWHEARGFTFRR